MKKKTKLEESVLKTPQNFPASVIYWNFEEKSNDKKIVESNKNGNERKDLISSFYNTEKLTTSSHSKHISRMFLMNEEFKQDIL